MNQIKIGKFISACRKAKGLTQQDLADKLGLTAKAVSKWECGKGLPDVSLYETICQELGITLNEFFAGERIEVTQIVTKADENLEDILKDYYKMKSQKNTIITALIVLLVIAIGYVIFSIVIFGGMLWLELFGSETVTQNDIRQYDKDYYFETYSGDLDSGLLIFPDVISDNMKVLNFESSFTTGLFDTYGYILLDYSLDDAAFEQEILRLSSLEVTLENHDGAVYTNTVKYSKDAYSYPAYITIDGYTDTFEYALIDEENNRIICIYLTYLESSGFEYEEYLKKEPNAYNLWDSLKEFSMYSHSFDGGDTYVEIGD